MNTKKIKFTADNTEKEIEVRGCYPFLVNSTTGKVVLRISASIEDTTFDDLYALKDNTSGIVEEYERTISTDPETGEEVVGEWELVNRYTDYESGEVYIALQDGIFNVEVTRVDGVVKETRQLRADVDFIAAMTDVDLDE